MGQEAGNTEHDKSGRFVGTVAPTEKMRAFAALYVANGGKQQLAAKHAKYSDWKHEGSRLVRNPTVQALIQAERRRALDEIGTIAVGTLRDMLTSDDTPAGVRADLTKYAIGLAGHIAPKAGGDAPGEADKPMSEMSVDELEQTVRKLRQAFEQADRPQIDGEAQPAESRDFVRLGAPDGAPYNGQPLDIIDV